MNTIFHTLIITFLFCISFGLLQAQNDTLEIQLNFEDIQSQIVNAPNIKNAQTKKSNTQINLPSLNGKDYTFLVYETINLEEPLYSQFPQVRSYILIDKNNPAHRGRLSTGPDHINVMHKQNGQHIFIEPLNNKKGSYQMYKNSSHKHNITCGVEQFENIKEDAAKNRSAQSSFTNGATLRTYRIAIATTGEFYQAQGNNNTAVLAKINNYLNLLNDIFEDEVSGHFDLIGNNTAIMFNNPATDGIDPATVNTQLNTTQTVINNTIGAANYDIGHAFHTTAGGCCSGSGVASLGVTCEDSFKARGWTSATATASDDLFMGLFAHEIGHQFGADHSYYGTANNCFQRSPGNGYEPGSGNSLMSYEGICSTHNITPEVSTLYFHNHSLDQIISEMMSNSCYTTSSTNNAIPVVTAPVNKTIPRDTPFELIGSGTDGDGDQIIYNWEEFDTDNLVISQSNSAGDPNSAATSTTAPLFRSFDPSADGHTRVFPTISDIINDTQTMGEILPSVARNMKFRLTARDFKVGGGAVSCDEVDLTVDASIGPFDVTSQSSATTWAANGSNTATVTWNVAGTSSLCANVDILFSTDQGQSFPFTLASNVTNDGSHTFTIPSLPTSIGRVKIKCSDNYFFDINLGDITLTSTCAAVSTSFSPSLNVTAIEGSSGLNLSLSADFGTTIGNISGSITSSDPASSLAGQPSAGGCINFGLNVTNFDSQAFEVATSSTITFTNTPLTGNFGIVMTVYEGNFDPGSPCTNFVSSSYNSSTNIIGNTVSVTASPGLNYILVVGTFSATQPTLPASYTVTHTGTIYDGTPAPGTGFSYTFVAVNQATSNIAAIDASSDFTTLLPGTYTVHGLSYDNAANLNTYIGSSFSSLQSDVNLLVICGALSTNTINLTIDSSANCPPNYTGLNALSGPASGIQDLETDGAIESTQTIQAGATIDYDSGTMITLDAPFEVPASATFNAFIDGCGGALQNTEETKDK